MPTPAPTATDLPGAILDGLMSVAAQNPWLVVVLGLLVVTALVRSARIAIHDGARDAVRLFPRADKALLLARAGHRCEHHGRIGGRCRSTDRLEVRAGLDAGTGERNGRSAPPPDGTDRPLGTPRRPRTQP